MFPQKKKSLKHTCHCQAKKLKSCQDKGKLHPLSLNCVWAPFRVDPRQLGPANLSIASPPQNQSTHSIPVWFLTAGSLPVLNAVYLLGSSCFTAFILLKLPESEKEADPLHDHPAGDQQSLLVMKTRPHNVRAVHWQANPAQTKRRFTYCMFRKPPSKDTVIFR